MGIDDEAFSMDERRRETPVTGFSFVCIESGKKDLVGIVSKEAGGKYQRAKVLNPVQPHDKQW